MDELSDILAQMFTDGKSQQEVSEFAANYKKDDTSGNQNGSAPIVDAAVEPNTNTASNSVNSSSVFSGSGWGKPVKFVNTGVEQDQGRGNFKAEQTSTFENIPGTNTFPKIKDFDNLASEDKIDFYNNTLNNDGWDFKKYKFTSSLNSSIKADGVTATAPNGKSENFITSSSASDIKISTEKDIANFIDNNQLNKRENRKLDGERYRIQRDFNNNFVEEFERIIEKEDLNGIDDNAKSSIAALQKQKPGLFDDIRNNIIDKLEVETSLTDYQIEDLFENVVSSKKNEQVLESSGFLKLIHDDYKKGEYNYSWDKMVEYSTMSKVNEFTDNEKDLYNSIEQFKGGVLKERQEMENHPKFDENSQEYKDILEKYDNQLAGVQGKMEKVGGKKFYYDFHTGKQIDQDFDGSSESSQFEKYDATEIVNQYRESFIEDAGGQDSENFEENLNVAYENDAVEENHFTSHVRQQNVDFEVDGKMVVNKDSYNGFVKTMERLGYPVGEIGSKIENIPVNVILENWNLFSGHLDNASQNSKDLKENYLGQEIKDQKDIGGYLKATKDMSMALRAKSNAWGQLKLLNIDPSSYKRDASFLGELYTNGVVQGLPWTDNYMQEDAKYRIAKNRRGGSLSADQKIQNSQNLIDEVNQSFAQKGIKPIKVSKKQAENFEMSFKEEFASGAGNFTPMVGEFFVVGGIVNQALKVSKFGNYLNKLKTVEYITKSGTKVSGSAVNAYVARTGKSVDDVVTQWGLTKNAGKLWDQGKNVMIMGLIEEGKMWALDPLFGTEMPRGSGFGFYIGGTAARGLLPFKFGSQGSAFTQKLGRMANPVWEKVIKGGIGGAVAAETALPIEQLVAGHKSWQRWSEETYPDLNTVQRRFAQNLALFSTFGFQHFNRTDAAFSVGLGKHYHNTWNRKANDFGMAFNSFSSSNRGNVVGQPKKNTVTVGGKEYTKEQAESNYIKYLELSSQANQYVKVSEKVPEYQDVHGQKKMLDAQFDKLNKEAIARDGKPLFRVEVTTDGKNHDARKRGEDGVFRKQADAYYKKGKDGVSEIYIDARKVADGQIPHEIYHHITNSHLKFTPGQNAAFGARMQNAVQKALNESMRTDLDFMKFIEQYYGKDVLRFDKEGEIPANLIELLATNRGYEIFVSRNLISDIAFEYKKLTENIFTGADGKSKGGFAGKWLQPKLDLKDPATLIDYLARLASMSKNGEYNPNTINRLKVLLKDHRLGTDGQVYKTVKNTGKTTKEFPGSYELIVSLNSQKISKQIQLKDALKPILDSYKAGKISKEKYKELSGPITSALINIRNSEETRSIEKPKYKRTIDETFSEGKERVNKNFYNYQDIIVPTEGYKNLKPSEQKLNREYIFDMVDSYKERIIAAGKSKFDTPTYENMSIKEKRDFVFENTREELIKHIERFNPETAVKLVDKTGEITGFKPKEGESGKEYFDIDGYVNSYVGLKEGTATKKVSKQFFGEQLGTKAKNIVDNSVLEQAEVSLSKQIVLKDVLPLQAGTMEAAKGEMLKGKDIEVWKRFLKVHPKITLEKASDIEALTLKTIETVVPDLIKDMYSSKEKIDAAVESIKSKKLFIKDQVKNGEMTPKRGEELSKQISKTRKEIEAGFIAKTIVDNIDAHKASIYSNVSEVTGMSTGLENVMMSRKMPSGKYEDVFLTQQKANTKEGVKRVSTEMTTKTFDETGIKKKGNTAGNRPQKIIKLNNRQFLEKLGIKIEPGGEINIAEMLADRNIMTTLVPALQNSVNKMVTNQLFESLAKEMKSGQDIKTVNNLNRIITKAKSGKNFDLASWKISEGIVLKQFKDIVKKNPELDAQTWVSSFHNIDKNYIAKYPAKELLKDVVVLDMSNQKKIVAISMEAAKFDREFDFVTDKHIRLKKGTFEIFDSYGGVNGRTVNQSLIELATERGYNMDKIIINKTLKERNDNHAQEYTEFRKEVVVEFDSDLLVFKNVSQGFRYTLGEGVVQSGIMPTTVNSKGQTVFGRLSEAEGKALLENNKQKESNGSWERFKLENPKFKDVNIKAMKVNDNADVMTKHHDLLDQKRYKDINHPDKAIRDNIRAKYILEFRENVLAQKGFKYQETMLANEAMLEYFSQTVNRVHAKLVKLGRPEFALNFTQQLYQNQTNAGKGFIRGLASHDAVTTLRAQNLPQKIVKGVKIGETVEGKEEFRGKIVDKVSEGYRSEHEFQAANFGGNMVVNHVKNHGSTKNFKTIYDPIARSFRQSIIPKYVQKVIDKDGNTKSIFELKGTSLDMTSKTNFLIDRLIAETTIDLNRQENVDLASVLTNKVNTLQVYRNLQNIALKSGVLPSKGLGKYQLIQNNKVLAKAIDNGLKIPKKARGMSTFDFDETVGISENFVFATKGKQKKKISSAEWPFVGDKLLSEGWKMDFTDFNRVTDGKPGPLMQKLKNQIKKYGPENVFILTARAPESQKAIHDYLKTEGVSIPIKNITGLGNSTGEAKALWMLEKFAEGYNDMYFVDDAMPNVKAVKDVLSQLDIKSSVQQARILKSENISRELNDMLEYSLNIDSNKKFSKAEGKFRGKDKKRRKFFMTDSASDLELLIEPFYGKGKKGSENKKWWSENYLKVWEKGVNNLNTARQTIVTDYMSLRKQNKGVVKKLDKVIEGTSFTNDAAMRVYVWNKAGLKVPGLAEASRKKLIKHVEDNADLMEFAKEVSILTKLETGLKEPTETWWAETIASEISEIGQGVSRKKYLQEWSEVNEKVFSPENMNKMEAELGPKWRESMEDILYRMETGRTRSQDLGRIGNNIMNYLNGSVGAIMSLNTRSATLQLISSINFINHAENNPFKAAKAFANQPQYWKDFMKIMNSDMLKQRRDGLQINVSEAELAAAVNGKGSKAKRALAYILKQGYIPTKIADSFAISAGGATYYRNRAKMYEKKGFSLKEAESKAFIDFQAIAERTQQSSRPDLLSKQQVSFEGRLVLPFSNTPMQMNRIMMKEMLDLSKGRYEGFYGENSFTNKASKVAYYGGIQSAIFAGLQTGLFALMAFGDGGEDSKETISNKKLQAINTMSDSFLRGMGVPGAMLSGLKNGFLAFSKQDKKDYNRDFSEVGEALLNISPTIGSKFSKMDAAGNTYNYNRKEIKARGFSLDNAHGLEASAGVVEALGNVPINRAYKKVKNIKGALDSQNEAWERVLLMMGWSEWDLGIADEKNKKPKKTKKKTTFTGL